MLEPPSAAGTVSNELYVSPEGDDDWSGELPEPDGSDGPFETIERAQRAVRERREAGRLPNDLTVYLRGGTYRIEEPLAFGPEDSAPVTYAAYPDEEPVISGGRVIDGWAETRVNDVDAWKTTVPAVRDGKWYFRQLFVNGERRHRPRLPKEGFYEVAGVPYDVDGLWNAEGGVSYSFTAGEGVVEEWTNLADVDACIPHRWVQERSPIDSVDPATDRVTMEFYAKMWLEGGERLFFENVFEALSEPGEWYLDRDTGECWYVPKEGEDPDEVEVVAPGPEQLLRVEGDPEAGEAVEFLRFEGLTFAHAGWEYPSRLDAERLQAAHHSLHGADDAATSVQAQFAVPGALQFAGARNCTLEDCTVEHVGFYGLQFAQGCTGNRVVGCAIDDTGAGSVKIEGSPRDAPDARYTGRNRVTDNHLRRGGRVFPAGVGVLTRHSFGNAVAHNHVEDFYYSGVSCGWSWGYADCIDRDNRIEANHIHDIGQGLLSDMGGIYTLGVQPGTVLRDNHIHDVACYDYGGWAIYPDEGSSHLVIEGNVCHDTNRQTFHQHYGRENTVRNNVFAFGAEGGATLSRAEEHVSLTFERNVVVVDDAPVFAAGYDWSLEPGHLVSDLNLFYDVSGEELVCDQRGEGGPTLSFAEWRERGNDRHSVVADPAFADLAGRDLSLPEDSPARDLGIDPVDVGTAGPRRTPGAGRPDDSRF